jgi:hypothetical protein
MVYRTTPMGSKKHAAAVGIPVKAVTTADPPENEQISFVENDLLTTWL